MANSDRLSFIINRGALSRLAILLLALTLALMLSAYSMTSMPGKSFRGPLPPLTPAQAALSEELRRDVQVLAGDIGQRNVFYPRGLDAAVAYLESELAAAGYEVQRQTYRVQGVECHNLEVEIRGRSKPHEIVIIGAHYDSEGHGPAANDNGTGVAATLAIARRFAKQEPPARTLRFVFFVNEEPPFFMTEEMGSYVYAQRSKQRGEKIVAMVSLETIGYYSDAPASQIYPVAPIGWLYPDTGNFIAVVGNYASRALVREVMRSFRSHAEFPSEGAALPGWIEGVGWSDHWSFWQFGYPAIMVTDTAPFRYPHYHRVTDTPDRIDYDRTARVVDGFARVTADLAAGR